MIRKRLNPLSKSLSLKQGNPLSSSPPQAGQPPLWLSPASRGENPFPRGRGKGRVRGFFILAICLLVPILAGCDSLIPPEPTATPLLDDSPTLAPSPTVLPRIPTEQPNAFAGRSNPTQAALIAEGHPTDESQIPVLPTQATIPLIVTTADGLYLSSTYYGAADQPAPALLLLHGEEGPNPELDLLAVQLQQAGYNVMVLVMRGYDGSTQADWSRGVADVLAALNLLDTLQSVTQVGVIGRGFGAAIGATACGQSANCPGTLLLDPLERADLLPLDQLVSSMGTKPALLMVNNVQPESLRYGQSLNLQLLGEHILQLYTALSDAATVQQIIGWLETHIPKNQ